jgi:LAO/AO transport system kinase
VASAVPSLQLLERARAGDVTALGRLLSRIESGDDEVREALAEVYRSGGKAHVLGITGVPGSGKSMLISRLVQAIRQSGSKVAVLAVDPSSPFSGGALLGDRIRMAEVVQDPGVFIRSMATRGAIGGLASGALAAVDALDCCGYETVIIETVGVGQDEVEIARASQTTIVVSAPGLGDDIQAIKAGLLEIADIHVVSKCDRPDAQRTLGDLKAMMALSTGRQSNAWRSPVIATSAETGEGIGELARAVGEHRAVQLSSDLGAVRQRRIAEYRALKTAEDLLRRRFCPARNAALADVVERVARRQLDPFTAAESLLNLSVQGGA